VENEDHVDRSQAGSKQPVASHSFTTPELEAVIRRAADLQASQSVLAADGVSEADVLRIGQELGLEASAVRRAMAEVRSRPPDEHGVLGWFVGAGLVRASRVVQGSASDVATLLDGHLRDVELMLAQRRFANWTRYERDSSIAAGISRFTRTFSRTHQPLRLKQLDAAVSPLDTGSCLVELSIDLAVVRGGLVTGVFGSSSVVAAGWAGVVWATALADPLMILSVPVLAGSWVGMRAIYGTISRSSMHKLELLLDKLERDEIE
jgi:hypothetical protein